MSLTNNIFVPTVLNGYAWDAVSGIDATLHGQYGGIRPFFPLYDNTAGNSTWGNKCYVVYDTIMRIKRFPLAAIKKAEVLYSVRGPVPELLEFTNLLVWILDRGDDAAKDVNEWAGSNVINNSVFLHRIDVHEVNWSPEITNVTNSRQMYVKNLVVSVEYHLDQLFNENP